MMKKVTAYIMSAIMLLGSCNICIYAADENEKYYADVISHYTNDFADVIDEAMQDYQEILSDEDFFGKWVDGQMINEPKFAYDMFPALSAVEDAAKDGDYSAAKEAVFKYYKQRFKDDNYERPFKTSDRIYRLHGEMIMDNLMMDINAGIPMGKLTLTYAEEEHTVNLLEGFEKNYSVGVKKMSIKIFDSKKDGYMARFCTKENNEDGGKKKPYVKMILNNGEERIYECTADNTIRGGDYFSTSYSTDSYMYANESPSSINTDSYKEDFEKVARLWSNSQNTGGKEFRNLPVDSYTRRACLMFDFSDIKPEDKIESVTLYLWGQKVTDEEYFGESGAAPSEKNAMNVYVVNDMLNTVWKENGHCWSKESSDLAFSYDGEYGPNNSIPTVKSGQWGAQMTQQQYAVTQMLNLYRGTGEEAYAYHAIRLSVNAALRLGNDFTQVTQYFMHAGTRNSYFAKNFYTLVKSIYMTPEYFTLLLKQLYLQTNFLVEGWSKSEEGNNIGSIATDGLLIGALTFREFKRYYDPLEEQSNPEAPGSVQGGWRDVGVYRALYKLDQTVKADGSSVEVPFDYTVTNVSSIYNPFSWAETLGIMDDISDAMKDENGEPNEYAKLFGKSAKYLMQLQNPLRGTWQSGDDANYLSNCAKSIASYARKLLGHDDPLLEWIYSEGKTGSPPKEYTSYANDTAKKTTLRSSWGEKAVSLYMDADGGWYSHAHNDDLAVGLMAYGQYFLIDPLKHSYNGDQEIVMWQSSTRAHNTVEINNASQIGGREGYGRTKEPFGEVLYFPDISWSKTKTVTDPETSEKKVIKAEMGSLHPERRYLGDIYDYVRAETEGYNENNNVSGGVFENWRDVLFVRPGYFIVTDYIKPENTEENTYKQAWHMNVELDFEVEEESNNTVTKNYAGPNLVIAPVVTDGGLTATIRSGYYCPTGSNKTFTVEKEYVTYDKTKKGVTTYNTILYPTDTGHNAEITTQPLQLDIPEDKANAFSAVIKDKTSGAARNISYYTLFDANQKQNRTFGEYKTDAELAFVEKTAENYTTLILKNATNLSLDNGDVIVYNKTPIEHIGVREEDNAVYIDVKNTEDIDKASFKVYCRNDVRKVYINNEEADYFEKAGNYVYLTETGNKDVDPSPSDTEKPGHSTGSNTGGGGGGTSGNKDTESGGTGKPGENGGTTGADKAKFSDIEGHWAQEYIKEASEKNLINGDGNGKFNPDNAVTRAELIAMLMRITDEDETEYDGSFSDVNKDDWFAPTIAKALKTGVISRDFKFRPNDFVTREEMCKMVINIYTLLNGEIEPVGDLSFADRDSISLWAEEFVKKAVSAEIITGIDKYTFSPKGTATRAQAATVICRMLNKAS